MKAKEGEGDSDVVPEALAKDPVSADAAALANISVRQLKVSPSIDS